MSPAPCRLELRRLLALRDADELTAEDARRLREHLAACASCREAAVEEDPTLLFLSMAGEIGLDEGRGERRGPRRATADDLEAERLVADVLAAVEVEKSRRRLAPARQVPRTVLRAASVALLGGVLGALFLARQPIRELLAPSGPKASAVDVADASTARVMRPAVPAAAAIPSRPVLEDLKNPGATVYEFASRSPQEPTVVFVVDPNADL